MADEFIDAVGLQCPMPIAKISAGLKELASGKVVEAKADDPAFKEDVTAFCRVSGHELVDCTETEDGITTVTIKVK